MGGRGSSSVSSSMSRNAVQHKKFMNGELSARYSKSDEFYNEKLFAGMNYWRENVSKSSQYRHADRVSADGNKIAVKVSPAHIRETQYGYSLQLDRNTVVYMKEWQVVNHREPYKGSTGMNVVLDRRYFNPKKTRFPNKDFAPDPKNTTFEAWKKAAIDQQRAGIIVSF